MDISSYSSDSRAVIKVAREVAVTFRQAEIEVEHLLLAVVRHEGSAVESILNQLGKSPAFVEDAIESYLKDQPSRSKAKANPSTSPAAQEVLAQAIEEKSKLYDPLVEPEHIFIAAFDPKSRLSGYVRDKVDISKEDIYNAIADSKSVSEIAQGADTGSEAGATSESKPTVSGTLRYCTDMTNLARAGEFDPVIGREAEIQQVIQVLMRRRKNSPVLVGGAGVGKSAIVEGFSQPIVDGGVPEKLKDVKVMEVDMGAMVAGAKYKGEFEERFKSLIGEVVKSGGKVILFIDEIHTMMGAGSGGGGGMDAANLLKPALARGQLRLIGATTEEEYTKYVEKDKAMDRRFERVKVEEPGFEDSVRIVKGVIAKYEKHHGIKYNEDAITGAVKFSQRYLSERNLPDVALDIIAEAASAFLVKEETTRDDLPKVEKHMGEVEKLIQSCEGKDRTKDAAQFKLLYDSYDEFSRQMNRLQEAWGHRLEVKK